MLPTDFDFDFFRGLEHGIVFVLATMVMTEWIKPTADVVEKQADGKIVLKRYLEELPLFAVAAVGLSFTVGNFVVGVDYVLDDKTYAVIGPSITGPAFVFDSVVNAD